jgi:hypothetical protein
MPLIYAPVLHKLFFFQAAVRHQPWGVSYLHVNIYCLSYIQYIPANSFPNCRESPVNIN